MADQRNPPSRTDSVAAQAHNAVALGDGRVRLAWAEADTPGKDGAAVDAARWEPARSGRASSARLVRLILSDAVSEAALVQSHASGQSLAISEAAEREAADIRRQVSAQSAAIREAAEREAAELLASISTMPPDLDLVASYITEKLTGPVERVIGDTGPAGGYPKPAKQIGITPRTRQYRTMRVFAGTIAGLVVLAVGTGAYQLGTRGYTFFVFRSAGTGATDNNAVFPGIVPTPKPSPAHHLPATAADHHGRAHHGRHHPQETRHHASP